MNENISINISKKFIETKKCPLTNHFSMGKKCLEFALCSFIDFWDQCSAHSNRRNHNIKCGCKYICPKKKLSHRMSMRVCWNVTSSAIIATITATGFTKMPFSTLKYLSIIVHIYVSNKKNQSGQNRLRHKKKFFFWFPYKYRMEY